MVEVRLSTDAERDLDALFDYGVTQWGVDDALHFVFSLDEAYELIGAHPLIGRERPEIGTGVRSWLHKNYVIFYRVERHRIEVGRIVHGAAEPAPQDTWQ